MWLLQALNLRLKTHPISGLDQAGKVRQPTFPFKSSSRSVLRPDTALMLECVPRSKSSDCNKSAPVVFLFFRACREGQAWILAGERFIPQSPNLFWPSDHAWCVASEIDLLCTLVSGSNELAHALLAEPRLETWRVFADDPVDADSDEINS